MVLAAWQLQSDVDLHEQNMIELLCSCASHVGVAN